MAFASAQIKMQFNTWYGKQQQMLSQNNLIIHFTELIEWL